MNMIPLHISNHRLIAFLSLLFLNPLPIIHGAPTYGRHREPTLWNSDQTMEKLGLPKGIIPFQGFFGCKYEPTVCNDHEVCLNDNLFGQCWHDEHAIPMLFALQNGRDQLLERKLPALQYTFDFLDRFHLTWHDYVTQCILSHIFTDQHHALDRSRLDTIYRECFDQVGYVARGSMRESNLHQDDTGHRSAIESRDLHFDLDDTSDISLLMHGNHLEHIPHRTAFGYYGERRAKQFGDPYHLIPHGRFLHANQRKSKLNHPKVVAEKAHPQDFVDTEETMDGRLMNNVERYLTMKADRGYLIIDRDFKDQREATELLKLIGHINTWPMAMFTEVGIDQNVMTYSVKYKAGGINASDVASSILNHQKLIEHQLDLRIIDVGIGNPARGTQLSVERYNGSRLTITILVIAALIVFLLSIFGILNYIYQHDRLRHRLTEMTHGKSASSDSYRELCSEPTQDVSTDFPTAVSPPIPSPSAYVKHDSGSSSASLSPRDSTSGWTEEPLVPVNMDIMTGHLILSYMEEHLNDRHRLAAEWQALCADEASGDRVASCSIALSETNIKKNRSTDCIPYDHARIQLGNNDEDDDSDDDYINASPISDSDPKCKYIATQGPMPNTTNAFWQMVWEQGSCVIVALARPIENGRTMCHHYWPVEDSARFDDFEVNLVSEHVWSEDYLVRSFYLKNILTMETRTVTQFHFLTWEESGNPPSMKIFLDFRRKVNKCFRGRSSPIIVHCNDGTGRTGVFILLDMVLNRIYKGVREINIAATLEHTRDQRAKMVKKKEQFEFVFVAVAEEVNYLLSAISQ